MAQQAGDDAQVTPNQLMMWATWIVNKYSYLQLARRKTGSYLSIFPSVSVVRPDNSSTKDVVKHRKHLVMPAAIYDLPRDRGVEYITYPHDFVATAGYTHLQDISFQYIQMSEIRHVGMGPYSRPSVENPYYYVHGKYIGLLGVEDLPVTSLEIGLNTPFDPFSKNSIDDPVPVLEQFGDTIAREVFEMSRIQLLMPGDDQNEGRGRPEGQVSKQNVVSVNNNPENAVQS